MSNLPQPLTMLVFVVGVGAIAFIGVLLMMANLYRQMIRQRAASFNDYLARHSEQETVRMTKHRLRTEFCTYPGCNCPFDAPADAEWCARGLPHDPRGYSYDREDA